MKIHLDFFGVIGCNKNYPESPIGKISDSRPYSKQLFSLQIGRHFDLQGFGRGVK